MDFPKNWNELNTILAHDWLTGMRGGEHVLSVLCEGFPKAPIYTLVHNKPLISDTINQHDIRTSWIQRMPGVFKYYRYWLPFFPSAIERLNLPEADLLISSSHCAAKGIRTRPETKHLCYCHTPMRYAWTFYEEYFGKDPLKRILLKPTLNRLRKWDKSTSVRVNRFVANSDNVRKRINTFYGRDADVVYPPVNTEYFTPDNKSHEEFDLIVSALVPYKRVDLAITAYTHLGYPLKVVGVGTDMEKLQKIAGSNITFMGWQDNDTIRDLYRRCRHLIFPGEEDFGMVPVEAQACGRPIIAYGRGGALESIVKDETGVFFDAQTTASLLAAVEKADAKTWDSTIIRKNAERFSVQSFIEGMDQSISKVLAG